MSESKDIIRIISYYSLNSTYSYHDSMKMTVQTYKKQLINMFNILSQCWKRRTAGCSLFGSTGIYLNAISKFSEQDELRGKGQLTTNIKVPKSSDRNTLIHQLPMWSLSLKGVSLAILAYPSTRALHNQMSDIMQCNVHFISPYIVD